MRVSGDSPDQYRQGRESRDEFWARLTQLLPNFPDEVLRQWLFESSGVLDEFPWLDPTKIAFNLETWPTDQIIQSVKHWHERGVEIEVEKFLTWDEYRDEYRLCRFMREHGTWPVPPIVFRNDRRLPIQFGGGNAQLVMLEGMHRLGFLRAMAQSEPARLQLQHSLWLAREAAA